MTEPATNPTEPVNPPAPPTPPVDTPPVEPAKPADPTLLAEPPKADDPKPPEPPKEPAKEPAKAQGAPEKYEFVAPEGKAYDPTLVTSFAEAAKEANLTQEAAQKLMDKMAPAMATRQAEQVQTIRTEWVTQSRADKEFGGEKLAENLGMAKKAMDQFSTPELRTLLETTGLGNHPEVIRLLYRAGKAISEDKFVAGAAQVSDADVAKKLFPTMA